MAERKICVITGTRAEYGLLYWLMRDIENDPSLALQLIVTGTHLEPAFGHTVDVIEADGFHINARVPIELSGDTPVSIARSTGLATSGIAEALETLSPDIVVLLGDRFEMLAAATAATICTIPIAHIHGGEITEGAIDDAMRHAITKLSSIHFVAAEAYRNRVIQLGEHPDTVFAVGAPGLDHISRTELLSADDVAKALEIEPGASYFLITMHPTTRAHVAVEDEIDALLRALTDTQDHIAIFTGVNADAGRDIIAERIEAYVANNPSRSRVFNSLGQVRYLSAMKHAAVVVGNSSSGIIEAPAFGVPTVNIGDRQKGRLRATSIIDTVPNKKSIYQAITKALSSEFENTIKGTKRPYGIPGASENMATIIHQMDLDKLTQKSFYDLPSDRIAS
jgi:UDP-hydrolysing UDP-N-acetyl-D-glucosamine 2-epimerase